MSSANTYVLQIYVYYTCLQNCLQAVTGPKESLLQFRVAQSPFVPKIGILSRIRGNCENSPINVPKIGIFQSLLVLRTFSFIFRYQRIKWAKSAIKIYYEGGPIKNWVKYGLEVQEHESKKYKLGLSQAYKSLLKTKNRDN